MKTALLIVEKDFLATHVGVRQVILFYWERLEDAGYRVTLATPSGSRLFAAKHMSLADVVVATNRGRSDAPEWRSSDKPDVWERALRGRRPTTVLKWSDVEVRPGDFAVSIVTNPWLCANDFTDQSFSAGIVYDMVPNLLACGALRLATVAEVYAFAHAHDVGYGVYQRQAERILAISESARSDFLAFYHGSSSLADRTEVVIPFEPPTSPKIRARPGSGLERPKLLLVNVLDPRKNFKGVEQVVRRAISQRPFDIDVVGRERMAASAAEDFMAGLAASGAHIRWFRAASDVGLQRLYSDADVLLFPSFYEGLGLPILEAQAHGTPVISSSLSSCGEINFNPTLAFEPDDVQGMAGAMDALFRGSADALWGHALKDKQDRFLETRNTLPADWQTGPAATSPASPEPNMGRLLTGSPWRRKG